MNRRQFQALSRLRLREAKVLLDAAQYPGAYYLMGYAVECALKACIAKQVKLHDFPDKKVASEAFTHDLEKLLRVAGLTPEFDAGRKTDAALNVSWGIVKDWSESIRYEENVTRNQADDFLAACVGRSGVLRSGKETMVNTVLTKEMIDAGAALVSRLEQSNVQPDAAFWFYFAEDQKWKLVLSEVRLSADGPRKIYQEIQQTLFSYPEELEPLDLEDITLAAPTSPTVATIRHAMKVKPGATGVRLTNNVINGNVIDDAYIYRLL